MCLFLGAAAAFGAPQDPGCSPCDCPNRPAILPHELRHWTDGKLKKIRQLPSQDRYSGRTPESCCSRPHFR